ncbi:MAG: sigma-70 family RNA polymerase sigma factor [Moraxellaceae bacterium]|nr:sigma-70 family RNA polymerase sigma factor [Pseudomonadales bacterium]MCP5173928.1 sigma-70 family RNA polymerase sigma factor [Moraxellaceae bacterium]MCP5177649.1 sigma-70 family RNA polymerase sigma factor [Moraxellaceae bacterium]
MDEQALVAKLLSRDPVACKQWVQCHHGRLVSVARAIVGDAAEDVVQEAWLLAFKALPKFEGRAALGTWLTRIVINAAYAKCRYEKTRFALSLEAENDDGTPLLERFDNSGHWSQPLANWQAETPDDILSRQELADILQKAVNQLPEAQRLVWLLRDKSDLSFKEIAEDLRLSEANVRVLLHRARLKLLAVINQYEEGLPC